MFLPMIPLGILPHVCKVQWRMKDRGLKKLQTMRRYPPSSIFYLPFTRRREAGAAKLLRRLMTFALLENRTSG